MKFRPLNLELMMNCAETPSCTNCKFRVGCPMRKRFYDQDERATELRFQMAEILTSTKNFHICNSVRKFFAQKHPVNV